jgi:hypothetical protein
MNELEVAFDTQIYSTVITIKRNYVLSISYSLLPMCYEVIARNTT